jgi:hypothetical protein
MVKKRLDKKKQLVVENKISKKSQQELRNDRDSEAIDHM